MQDMMMEQNIIITERCRSLRQLGRNALRGKWGIAILAMVLYTVCMTLPVLVFNQLFGTNLASYFTSDGFTYNFDAEFYQQMYNNLPQTSVLSGIWALLISGALELGATIYFLATFRGHNVRSTDVFLGFERFGKALGLFLFRYLFICLWTMLFIVPGIIAAIRYSQAFFVLADDPGKSVRQCMNESKAMMRGNKAKFFLLGLSFIGWYLLASIPGSFIRSICGTLSDGAAAAVVAGLLSALIMTPLTAYMFSTFAGFYEILAGHLIKETQPAPLSAEQINADVPVERIEEVIEDVEAEAAQDAIGEALPEDIEADPAKAGQTDSIEGAAETEQPEQAAAQAEQETGVQEDQGLIQALDEEDKYHD